MTDELTLAVLQIAPGGSVEENLDAFEQQVREVAASLPSTSLIVAPEQHLSVSPKAFLEPAEDIADSAVPVPGALTDRLAALASEVGIWLVPGTVYEQTSEGTFNSALAFSPAGDLVATYRKIFPWQPFEPSRVGRHFVCFDVPGVARIGLAICYDGAFPELFRQLAWLGADIVVQPTLTSTVDREAEIVMARANAIANQFYVVNVNAAAPNGIGRSVIIDPEGTVRVEAGPTEQVLTYQLDIGDVRRVREHGAFGLNRFWDQIDRYGSDIELPAYGGSFVPREVTPPVDRSTT